MLTTIIILIVLCLTLGIVEIALTPGFGIAGTASVVLAATAVALIYNTYGFLPALVTTIIGTLLFVAGIWWLVRSKTLNRMALHSSIDSSNARPEQLSVRVGQRGKAVTRLALIGNAEIEGKLVEVKSNGAFIDPGTAVEVVGVSEAQITVKPV